MKIYFSGAIRAGRENALLHHQLVKFLSDYGKVLTSHIGDMNLTEKGEAREINYIYRRDMRWIKEADIVIAEISTPSVGVGYEIRHIEEIGKPVICLYFTKSPKNVSGMIEGNKNIKLIKYDNFAKMEFNLRKELDKHKSKIFYNKLIRDKIPEIIKKQGKKYRVSTLSFENFKKALKQKLVEESKEFAKVKTINKKEIENELVDLKEVIEAIEKAEHISTKNIAVLKREKNKKRGTFEKKKNAMGRKIE
ncbi:hypothetical protein COT77_02860 [Candidatus Berkelbacteria bacterium CG10_big_fil_rev_8_21_14_0_10_41_12]|uniref:Putative 2'-deoxynucleoside 5'-phosphate N-hydrolase 1 n=1 Tax=Candidatus Berkelbacteria bacterium CG10_big_fil_rev_8_21_14_0_10_41_12 TaxID=1974513 RepID=A0A2M6WWK6_9BACT|nr:MAG: hypothetical protein COT77_02860 [Candidatus Berkelbacteria bacterium CG10_big_fil_rev_8_21_14_0_10_41_12]